MIAEHRQRQFGRRTQHLDLGREHLDQAGGQIRVLGPGGAIAHLAVDPHHPFRAQLLGILEGRAVGIDHHLGQAVMVAQVDKQQTAMVADAVDPAGQPYGRADIGLAERAAGMGAITMHGGSSGRMRAQKWAGSAGKAHGGRALSRQGNASTVGLSICILRGETYPDGINAETKQEGCRPRQIQRAGGPHDHRTGRGQRPARARDRHGLCLAGGP